MLTIDTPHLLDDLLGTSVASFDIPLAIHNQAVERYEALGDWLADHWAEHPDGGLIYPQGSIRLGTMVAPVTPGTDYDIDLVCRRDITKESTTQKGLKTDVGNGVAAYIASRPDGAPRLSEGKRCWTLDYLGEPFHMDVLPAVPDADADPHGILLTDRDLVRWQPSNPVGYADWFYAQMTREYREVREVLAKQMDVEDVPAWYVKTTLQRTVQALKRHRDIYFSETPDDRPASIIITTLAARAYPGAGSLYEVLRSVTETMPTLIERRDNVWWVENPVQTRENFADRWQAKPDSAERFFRWIAQASIDFGSIGQERGIDRVLAKIGQNFGEGPKRSAANKYGMGMRDARDAGRLGIVAGTGTLGGLAAKSRAIPPHTFHGDAPNHP